LAAQPPFHVPHSIISPSTSGGVSNIFSAIAKCALYEVAVGIRIVFRNILKPNLNFLNVDTLYDLWILLEFKIKAMLIGIEST
jgi:hypothetical protein